MSGRLMLFVACPASGGGVGSFVLVLLDDLKKEGFASLPIFHELTLLSIPQARILSLFCCPARRTITRLLIESPMLNQCTGGMHPMPSHPML